MRPTLKHRLIISTGFLEIVLASELTESLHMWLKELERKSAPEKSFKRLS